MTHQKDAVKSGYWPLYRFQPSDIEDGQPFKLDSKARLRAKYTDDRVLRSYLARVLPEAMLAEIEPQLAALGEMAGRELYRFQLADRLNEPVHTVWDAWGTRIDRIELTPLWIRAERIAAEAASQ